MGGRASKAQEYPEDLCKAICRGLANQKRYDESGRVCTGNLDVEALSSLVETMASPVVSECMRNSVSQSDVSQSSDVSRGSLMLAPISSDEHKSILQILLHFHPTGRTRSMSRMVRTIAILLRVMLLQRNLLVLLVLVRTRARIFL